MVEGLGRKIPSALQRVSRAREFGIFLFFLFLYVFLLIRFPAFRNVTNQLMVATQFAWIAIIAVGMTLVIITAGIDLSVGSVLALAACSMGRLLAGGMNVWLGLALGLAVGALCGLTNGLAITFLKIPPFIATLGMMGIARGLTFVTTGGWPSRLPDELVTSLGQGRWLGVPAPVLVMAVVAIAGSVFLRHTTTGRYIYAIGGNEEAARLSGIKVDRIKLIVYTITGLLAGLAGIVLVSYLKTAEAAAGTGSELRVIAAVIVGGTSLMGGEGSVLGTVIGAAILGIIPCGLSMFRVTAQWELVAAGGIIIIAVALDQLKRR